MDNLINKYVYMKVKKMNDNDYKQINNICIVKYVNE